MPKAEIKEVVTILAMSHPCIKNTKEIISHKTGNNVTAFILAIIILLKINFFYI